MADYFPDIPRTKTILQSKSDIDIVLKIGKRKGEKLNDVIWEERQRAIKQRENNQINVIG
jgi:hypothetical protein